MGDGVRLATAILILLLAMVAFFFAFHPGGVEGATGPVNNPGDILRFMFTEFDNTANGTTPANNGPEGDTTARPTGIVPGTSHIGVQGGA